MRLLITGIHGFVGSNLVAQLGNKYEIYGLDIVAPEKPGVVRTFSWDDLDAGNVPQVDMIIHLAGKAHDTKNKSAADIYFKINTILTENIYDYFLKSKAEKFLFFSSVKAAADFVPGDILTEDIVPAPVGPYGESKIKAEEYIKAHPASDGKKVYIFRPCMIHGPGNKGNLNLLLKVVEKGIPWPLGSFENLRTFTSIDNLIFIIDRLIEGNAESGIYNIADDTPVSTNRLIELICEANGKKARIWHLPKGLVRGMAKIGTICHLPLNNDRLNKLTENYIASNAKIKKAIGVGKLPTRAEDGLRSTIKSLSGK